jgi:hypothetical protein
MAMPAHTTGRLDLLALNEQQPEAIVPTTCAYTVARDTVQHRDEARAHSDCVSGIAGTTPEERRHERRTR